MARTSRFSRREGIEPQDAVIHIRSQAPPDLREAVIQIAYEAGLRPTHVRHVICDLLRKRPDPNNWSDYPNVDGEVNELIHACEWFEVYDLIEELSEYIRWLAGQGGIVDEKPNPDLFVDEVNRYFRREGVGWQLAGCEVQMRGPEQFEATAQNAIEVLSASGRATAENEFHQARLDLSRRPEPDVTGSIQHSLAGLEVVARSVCDDPKATLGDLLKKYPDLLPPPLNQCVEKAWGYASNFARHLSEDRTPTYEEAELLVSLSAAVATYLTKKAAPGGQGSE